MTPKMAKKRSRTIPSDVQVIDLSQPSFLTPVKRKTQSSTESITIDMTSLPDDDDNDLKVSQSSSDPLISPIQHTPVLRETLAQTPVLRETVTKKLKPSSPLPSSPDTLLLMSSKKSSLLQSSSISSSPTNSIGGSELSALTPKAKPVDIKSTLDSISDVATPSKKSIDPEDDFEASLMQPTLKPRKTDSTNLFSHDLLDYMDEIGHMVEQKKKQTLKTAKYSQLKQKLDKSINESGKLDIAGVIQGVAGNEEEGEYVAGLVSMSGKSTKAPRRDLLLLVQSKVESEFVFELESQESSLQVLLMKLLSNNTNHESVQKVLDVSGLQNFVSLDGLVDSRIANWLVFQLSHCTNGPLLGSIYDIAKYMDPAVLWSSGDVLQSVIQSLVVSNIVPEWITLPDSDKCIEAFIDVVEYDENNMPVKPVATKLPLITNLKHILKLVRSMLDNLVGPLSDSECLLKWMVMCSLLMLDSRCGELVHDLCWIFSKIVTKCESAWLETCQRYVATIKTRIGGRRCLHEGCSLIGLIRGCGIDERICQVTRCLSIAFLSFEDSEIPTILPTFPTTLSMRHIATLLHRESRHFCKTTSDFGYGYFVVKLIDHLVFDRAFVCREAKASDEVSTVLHKYHNAIGDTRAVNLDRTKVNNNHV